VWQSEYEDDELWHVPDEYPVSESRKSHLYKIPSKVWVPDVTP
jgi:hypothetical protein